MTPEPGRTYALAEADYKYGAGPLSVTVTRVVGETTDGGEPWFEVEAVVKAPGTYGPGQARTLYVRAASLRI